MLKVDHKTRRYSCSTIHRTQSIGRHVKATRADDQPERLHDQPVLRTGPLLPLLIHSISHSVGRPLSGTDSLPCIIWSGTIQLPPAMLFSSRYHKWISSRGSTQETAWKAHSALLNAELNVGEGEGEGRTGRGREDKGDGSSHTCTFFPLRAQPESYSGRD